MSAGLANLSSVSGFLAARRSASASRGSPFKICARYAGLRVRAGLVNPTSVCGFVGLHDDHYDDDDDDDFHDAHAASKIDADGDDDGDA